MLQSRVERRRGRRAAVPAPLVIRRSGSQGSGARVEEQASNVSLAGVYFETTKPYAPDEIVIASVSIPEPSQTRDFPFTRLAGRSRVVRVEELPPEDAGGEKRFGIALEFGSDVTALSAIPGRG